MSAFDLDQFAPAPVKFRVGGIEYGVPGDPDVDDVAVMLRIEDTIRDADGVESIAAATREGKELICRMVLGHDVEQDVTALKLGTAQVLTVFSLILHGASVAAVVASALTLSDDGPAEAGESVATREDGADVEGEEGENGPLALRQSSSTQSSLSEDIEDGLPATGSG